MGRVAPVTTLQSSRVKDPSIRPIIAMDYFFMRMESAPTVQTISDESITCVAVKEDRHQNIMSSGDEEGSRRAWTVERVVKFIDLLGY